MTFGLNFFSNAGGDCTPPPLNKAYSNPLPTPPPAGGTGVRCLRQRRLWRRLSVDGGIGDGDSSDEISGAGGTGDGGSGGSGSGDGDRG